MIKTVKAVREPQGRKQMTVIQQGARYVREYSESAYGGASMLHDEYVTYDQEIKSYRVRQSDDEMSGFDCRDVSDIKTEELDQYSDLPVK